MLTNVMMIPQAPRLKFPKGPRGHCAAPGYLVECMQRVALSRFQHKQRLSKYNAMKYVIAMWFMFMVFFSKCRISLSQEKSFIWQFGNFSICARFSLQSLKIL